MVRSRFSVVLVVLSLIAMPFTALFQMAARFGRSALALIKPEPPRLAGETFGLIIRTDGNALPRGIQNGLRHEAGVPRYAANRKR
jgi:hypothetical protein